MKIFQILFLLFFASLAEGAASQAEWYTVVGGSTFELSQPLDPTSVKSLEVTISLSAKPEASVQFEKLKAKIVDISNKYGRATDLRDKFKVELKYEPERWGGSLEVKVPDANLLPVGSYSAIVGIADYSSAAPQASQQLILTLNVPAPHLRVQPFAVHIVRPFLFFDTDSVDTIKLELTGRASIRDLTLNTYRESVPSKPGDLSFKLNENNQPKDDDHSKQNVVQTVHVKVSGTDSLPLGDTEGKLEVRSKDLQTPVLAAYKVRVIESKAWIFVLAGFGAILGFVLRKVLKPQLEYKAALANASELIGSINNAESLSLDEDYRNELNRIRQTLSEGKTAENLLSAINAAKK